MYSWAYVYIPLLSVSFFFFLSCSTTVPLSLYFYLLRSATIISQSWSRLCSVDYILSIINQVLDTCLITGSDAFYTNYIINLNWTLSCRTFPGHSALEFNRLLYFTKHVLSFWNKEVEKIRINNFSWKQNCQTSFTKILVFPIICCTNSFLYSSSWLVAIHCS